MADVKISQLPSATLPVAGTEVLPIVQSSVTSKVSISNILSAPNPGNLQFTGTGNRIRGDFSNATIANRVMFQTSTVNGGTNISLIPNGTVGSGAGSAQIRLEDNTSISTGNGAFGGVLLVQDTDFRVQSTRAGTGTYLPMTFYTGGSERVRIDTSGNVGIGTSTPSASAILDAQSTTKGVRMPNMTTTQKNAIASPAAGLMVFDTTLSKLSVYSGAAWQTITSV